MSENRLQRIRFIAASSLFVISGIILLLLPVVAWNWVQLTPFPGFLLDPNLVVSGGASERHWQARQLDPPVEYPARVTAVDGATIPSNSAFWDFLRTYDVGDEVAITFEQPHDSLIAPVRPERAYTATFTLTRLDASSLWSQFWLPYLVSVIITIIGAGVLWARPQAEAAQVFAVFVAFGAVTAAGLFDLATTQYFARFWGLALAFVGAFNLLLAAVFPHELGLLQKRPYWRWLLLLPSFVIAVWSLRWLYSNTDPWAYVIPWRAAFILSGAAVVLGLIIMAHRGFRSPSPRVRQQARIILAGAVLAFSPLILFYVTVFTPLAFTWVVPAFYISPITIYPLVIGYTIIRYRLLDVDFRMQRQVWFTLLAGLVVAALTLLATGLITAIWGNSALNNPLVLVSLVIVIALLFDPVRTQLQTGVNQFLLRQPDYTRLLRAFNRELTKTVHLEQVTERLLAYGAKGAPLAELELYLYQEQLSGYANYQNDDDVISASAPLVAFLETHHDVIDLADERVWPEPLRAHRERVSAMEAAALAPIHNGRTLFGWLVVKLESERHSLRGAELSYLGSLVDQALIGLERADVVQRLEQRVTELNRLSQFSRMLNFTITWDDLLELVYTNFHRMFSLDNFRVVLKEMETDRLYPVFHVENGKRMTEQEGLQHRVTAPTVLEAVRTGQMQAWTEENGRFSMVAPLNAGAETLGAIIAEQRKRPLSDRRRNMFGVYADQAAIAFERLQTDRELMVRAQQLEIINEVTLSLASTLELDSLLNLILDKAIELLDTEAGTFMLAVDGTRELEFKVVRGPASEDLLGSRLPMGTGLAGTVAQSGRPIIVNQAQEDTRWFSRVDANTHFETHSILTVPMLRQSTILGVLQVINKRNGAPFNEEDERLLMAFAAQAVVALENARLLEQTDQALQDRVTELFLLQQLDRDLNTTLELKRVLSLTLDWALRICSGTAGAIVLLDGEGEPELRETHGYDDSFDQTSFDHASLKEGLVGQVLQTKEPHVTGNVHEEPTYIAASFNTHSQMTLPIIHKQESIGVLVIESDQFDAFDEVVVETAVRVTNHAAAAIANALLYQQVHAANLAKTEFVSMVSHELKTPMTSMRGYIDLLLSGMTGELNEQQNKFLETIAANIRRMQRQIRDLTDISRIETGRLLVTLENTAFSSVMSETLRTVQGPCDQKSIRLHLDLPPDLPSVMADKERLIQVLTNLLSNACKYSPPDTDVRVTFCEKQMALQNGSEPEPVVLCSVQDQGYGISQEDQQQLFTKFFRADNPNIRQAPGTGLGLSITKGIIELHGGAIWVESELGKGTTFCFAIPQGASL